MTTTLSDPVTLTHRTLSPRPPSFRKGSRVAFQAHDGAIIVGTFLRRFMATPRSAVEYEIRVGISTHRITANGPVGLSLTTV